MSCSRASSHSHPLLEKLHYPPILQRDQPSLTNTDDCLNSFTCVPAVCFLAQQCYHPA